MKSKKNDLYEKNEIISQDPLHLLIADDVHTMTTRSQDRKSKEKEEEEAREIIMKPYA